MTKEDEEIGRKERVLFLKENLEYDYALSDFDCITSDLSIVHDMFYLGKSYEDIIKMRHEKEKQENEEKGKKYDQHII